MPISYPEIQRPNFINRLLADLEEAISDGNLYSQAFSKVALRWLGYDDDEFKHVDGKGDRAFDSYRIFDNEISVFQFKSQDFTKDFNKDKVYGPEILADIRRIIEFFKTIENPTNFANNKVQQFRNEVISELSGVRDARNKASDDNDIFQIQIKLVCLGKDLSKQAYDELKRIIDENGVITVFGIDVICEIQVVFIDDLIAQKWKTSNSEWKDFKGKSDDWVEVDTVHGIIDNNKCLIAFVRARDLIAAYQNYGYQLFESNVRCEIKKSSVNKDIRHQIKSIRGISEFMYLNNGITVTCHNKSKKVGGKIRIHRPQIVNGLQTVTTLSDEYGRLTNDIRSAFDEHCYVLMRLYDRNTIADLPKLVRATNNQNPMESRNLRSNHEEQIAFEKFFAELGWFFERKEFAWQAFERDPTHWSTLSGKTARSFQVYRGEKGGRPIQKRADNQQVGQTWLSFIGFVDEAAQKKGEIFSTDKVYRRVFQARPIRHAFQYDISNPADRLDEEALPHAPSAEAFLLAFLSYQLAKHLVPSQRAHRQKMIDDMGIGAMHEVQQDERLRERPEYVRGLAIAASPFLFCEFVGYVLFKSIGDRIYDASSKILKITDMREMFQSYDASHIERNIKDKTYKRNEIFTQLWLMFSELIDELIQDSSWKNEFFETSSKPRFMYRKDTRRRIIERANKLDEVAARRKIRDVWSEHFDDAGGVYKAIQDILVTG